MNENFKRLLAETMKEMEKPDMEQQMKEMAEMTYGLYKNFVNAGFNEMQAMAMVLEIMGNASSR